MVRGDRIFGLIGVGAFTSLTLTFFHPAFWLAVGALVGVATLLIALQAGSGSRREPPAFYIAVAWTATTVLIAICYGASQDFYNFRQIAFLACGTMLGYLVSVSRAPAFLAWAPFCMFALYFTALCLLGRDPASAFPRNSENYVSVVLLALYASALLISRPPRIQRHQLLTAVWVLALSIWSGGRAGVLASLLLTVGLVIGMILRERRGMAKSVLAVFIVAGIGSAIWYGTEFLLSRGYLESFAARGVSDAPRLAILMNYFSGIDIEELLLGRNYYHDRFMSRWEFNLHNSYLSAWAHLGLAYLALILVTLIATARGFRQSPVIGLAVLAFALRALTDTHMLGGQYDYILLAALFLQMRARDAATITPSPVSSPT